MAFKDSLIALILRYPYKIMLANLLLMLVIGGGASQLYIESGIDVFFSKDDPNLLAELAIKRTYGKEDNIVFVIDAGDSEIFTRKNLATIAAITEQSWGMPHSKRVDSLTNFLYPEVNGDDIRIDALVEDPLSLSDSELDRKRQIAFGEKALLGRLLATGSNVAAVNINLNIPGQQKAAAIAESVQFARQILIDAEQANPDLKIHLAGWALTEQTLAEVTATDSVTLMPLLFGLVLVILALLLRSISASVCTVLVILLSIVVGMGYGGWAGLGINSVSVSAPTIIMTLAIADCIHVLTVFLIRLRAIKDKRAALSYSLEQTLYAVTLTSVTTALGFLSMNFSDSPPFRDLGNISAVGVVGALWVTVTVLPGLILLLPFNATGTVKTGLPMGGLANWVIKHHNRIFWLSLAFIALALSGLLRIELNDDPTGYFSDEIPLSKAIDIVETKLSGTQALHYSLDSGRPQGVADPSYLASVDRFVGWLRSQPEVVNVESFTEVLKRLNQVMHDDAEDWHRLPDSKEMAAQYILLYEISVPYGQDVTHQVSADKSSLRVTATLKNQKSTGLLAFEERSRLWLETNTPDILTRGAGQSISFAHVGLRNIGSMLSGSLFAVILISICLILAFRSVRFGVVSFIPNLFPALVTLGIWGAVVGEVNIAASVVFSLTLGIIVDDTTHFLVKYRDARCAQFMDPADAIRYTFASVGSALVSTSIVLAMGFLVLVQSDFSVNSTSGLLVAITIVIAILLDLLFLPAVLIKADPLLMPKQQPSV